VENIFNPACWQNPVLPFSIWKLADTFCLFRQNVDRSWRSLQNLLGPTHLSREHDGLIAQTRCGRFKSGQDSAGLHCFGGLTAHIPWGLFCRGLIAPIDISCRTPNITILSAFEPVENRTQSQVLVTQLEQESTRQIPSNSITFGRMRGGPEPCFNLWNPRHDVP
jgi:hypothetical protein